MSTYFPESSRLYQVLNSGSDQLARRPQRRSMGPQYSSQMEAIARQGMQNSEIRMNSMQNAIGALLRANSVQSRPPRAPRGPRNFGPPQGTNAGIKVRGKGPGGAVGPIRPNAPIVTIRDGQGHSVQVNKSVADDFKRFLRALERTGYNIESIGGYANRNIAGTNTRSLHSYGLAIDINPSANPVTYGRRVTNMPRGIGRLARRYGLVWGGKWKGSKKDPMHFSFPMFGTK